MENENINCDKSRCEVKRNFEMDVCMCVCVYVTIEGQHQSRNRLERQGAEQFEAPIFSTFHLSLHSYLCIPPVVWCDVV